eukprot:1304269-Amphidinium_carterae.1
MGDHRRDPYDAVTVAAVRPASQILSGSVDWPPARTATSGVCVGQRQTVGEALLSQQCGKGLLCAALANFDHACRHHYC